MLENLYTTKMSADKRMLQNRFSKIRSKCGRLSKLMAVIMSIVIASAMICATIVMAAVDGLNSEKSNIKFVSDGKEITFKNKPFVENNVLYLPLRELFSKLNVLDDDYSAIEWNDGKITIKYTEDIEFGKAEPNIRSVNFCYGIEIGKAEITLNPLETIPENFELIAHPVVDQMNYAPVLKNDITYVPWEYIDLMLSKALLIEDHYNLVCTISGEHPSAFVIPCLFIPANADTSAVSMPFGDRYNPVTYETTRHNGIDIVTPEGTDIYAATDGTVTEAGFDAAKGNYIVITNKNGVSVTYAHLSEMYVSSGDEINKRDLIAKSGKTGMATGPHLHFEVNIDGIYYNPELFW